MNPIARLPRSVSRSSRRWAVRAVLAAALIAAPTAGGAHEIPADVLVRVLIQARADTLTVLVRVPVEAMRDVEWPRRGPGYLDLERAGPVAEAAARLWLVDAVRLYAGDRALPSPRLRAARISAPSDRSFGEIERALAHVQGPSLPATTSLVPEHALLDAWLEVPVPPVASADLGLEPDFARLGLRTTTVVRFVTPEGNDRVYQYVGDPGRVRLDPGWRHAAWRFLVLGFEHILDGVDHLLFLACLVLPYRRVRPLVPVVTAFTAAHSLTLVAAAAGLAPDGLWFPPLVETLIAASIVWMAVENAVGAPPRYRWLVAFAFGLVHGFGFSFALGESLQFAGSWLLTSLLSFNVGVELGQLLVVALLVPVWNRVRRRLPDRPAIIVASLLIGHVAWHWMAERWGDFRAHPLVAPPLDTRLLAAGLRWTMLALIVAGAAWALYEIFDRWERRRGAAAGGPPRETSW